MDPVLLVAAAVQTAIVIALLFVLPGLAWGPLLVPGAGSALMVAGRAVGLSLLTTAVTCTLLARFGAFDGPVVVGALVGLTAAPVAIRLAGGRLGDRWRWSAVRPSWRLRPRSVRWWLGAIAVAGLAVVFVIVPSRERVGPDLLPITSTVWYYANLARAVATSGAIPTTLPEWGTQRPFQTDYLPVTAHTAAAIALLPGTLPTQLEIYRVAVLVAGLVVAALLFRRWFSSWTAALAAILLLSSVRLADKFVSYKPETWALVVALFTLWLADRALAERSRRLAALALASAAVVLLAHAEVFLVLVPALLGIGVSRAIDRRKFAPIGLALMLVIAAAASGAIASEIIWGGSHVAGYTLQLAASDTSAAAPPVRPDEIPAGWQPSRDPTWDFYRAAVSLPAQWSAPRPTSFFDSRLLARSILVVWPGLDGRLRSLLPIEAVLVGLPLLALPWLDRRRRRLVVTGIVFAIGLFAGSFLMFELSRTYVPERTGPRRLMPYEVIVPVVAGALVLWGIGRLLRPGWRSLVGRGWETIAAGMTSAVLVVAMIVPGPTTAPPEEGDLAISQVGYDAYGWIAANLPPDARILADAYTDGSVAALAQRVGLVDGRAVFLENPAFLSEATSLLLGARVVFSDPAGPGAAAYLSRERVGYLLALGPAGTSEDLGGYLPFPTDLAALTGSDRYTLVRTFGDGRLWLFRVRPAG